MKHLKNFRIYWGDLINSILKISSWNYWIMLLKYQFIPLKRKTVKPWQNLWLVFECQQLSLSLTTFYNSIQFTFIICIMG